MLRFPVKKIRKQFKLLLLLVLFTFAVWFTYLHINQGKAIKLHFNYGKGTVILASLHELAWLVVKVTLAIRFLRNQTK